MKKIFLSLLLISTCSHLLFSQEVNTAKLDSFFNALDRNNRAMGSFAISRKGKVVYQRSIGYASLEEQNKILASNVSQYRIGSITKVFTSVLIFQLIEQGKITLDTKLSKFFPQFPNAENITIENLLSHTSGLADYVNDPKDQIWITNPHTKAELLDVVAKGKIHFEPGKGMSYCNSGFLLLGYILEEITGQSYAKLIEKRISAKIGLKHTFSSKINNSGALEARPYAIAEPWKSVKDLYFPNIIGVGDILSTPTDMLTFINALTEGKLVSTNSFDLMKRFKSPGNTGMGLFGVPFNEKLGIGHSGGTRGTFSFLVKMEADDLAYAGCINGANFMPNDVTIAALVISYNQPYKIPVFLTAAELEPFLGNYSSAQHNLKISITQKSATLIGQATGQSPFVLSAIDKNKFEFMQSGISVEFNKEKQQMIFKQGGKTSLFEKEKPQ
ncbi:serine hydrolase domain-containing protein [Pedobacter caeni]|uniref:CubicO group peptidase, beta-lactamase class C family n=1 Tax=Pedobacter caeni TaxID=288992 RepID=A0A1M4U9Z8_9SPHI|nr:serine hydrolase domain-containing protein [Pedobacter caeni]SHE53602.1 CubicO group peptidase, beta-lactamase class C family [Pedobacter caeni]